MEQAQSVPWSSEGELAAAQATDQHTHTNAEQSNCRQMGKVLRLMSLHSELERGNHRGACKKGQEPQHFWQCIQYADERDQGSKAEQRPRGQREEIRREANTHHEQRTDERRDITGQGPGASYQATEHNA